MRQTNHMLPVAIKVQRHQGRYYPMSSIPIPSATVADHKEFLFPSPLISKAMLTRYTIRMYLSLEVMSWPKTLGNSILPETVNISGNRTIFSDCLKS